MVQVVRWDFLQGFLENLIHFSRLAEKKNFLRILRDFEGYHFAIKL